MCFVRLSRHKRAEKDITCYKVMTFNNETMQLRSCIQDTGPYTIGCKIMAREIYSIFKKKNVKFLDRASSLTSEVVHSFISLQDAIEAMNSVCITDGAIVECIIPEGEYYWVNNKHGEYASLSLRIHKLLYYCSSTSLKSQII